MALCLLRGVLELAKKAHAQLPEARIENRREARGKGHETQDLCESVLLCCHDESPPLSLLV